VKKKVILFMLFLMFISTNALSQNTVYGNISGDVQEGITVKIYHLSCGIPQPHATVITDAQGYYATGDLADGRYLVGPDDAACSFSSSYWVDIPQTVIQPYDFTSTVDIDVYILFLSPDGTSVAHENGLTYHFGGDSLLDPTIYPEELWGEYPLYLPGNMATIVLGVTYNGSDDQINLTLVTETYALNLDGSNGILINGPITTELVAVKDVTQNLLDASFIVPLQPKGLYRCITKVYHESTLLLTQEAIFCPPDLETLE